LSEARVGDQSIFPFIQEYKRSSEICILITSDASQALAARAAEDDIDYFILKPYSFPLLKRAMLDSILSKLNPNSYRQLIERGKHHLLKNEAQAAETAFTEAVAAESKPALALYYLAKTQEKKKKLVDAEKSYRKALALNQVHYRCLSGLNNLLNLEKRDKESYATMKKLVGYFPLNPHRLANALRMDVITENFQDTEWYYEIFQQLDQKPEELIRHMCSALVVSGKHFLNQKQDRKALQLFELAANCGAGRTKFLLYMVETLVNFEMSAEAGKFLSRLTQTDDTSADCMAAKFLVSTLSDSLMDSIKLGKKTLEAGVSIPSVYEKLITLSVLGGNKNMAKDLLQEASAKWPDRSHVFSEKLNVK
jgi:tetratricopeptide (TPR) repeat protein